MRVSVFPALKYIHKFLTAYGFLIDKIFGKLVHLASVFRPDPFRSLIFFCNDIANLLVYQPGCLGRAVIMTRFAQIGVPPGFKSHHSESVGHAVAGHHVFREFGGFFYIV